jgi:hypothetical protein
MLPVFQLLRFREDREVQPENVLKRLVTADVFHADTSKEERAEQPENVRPKSVTLEVSHVETFKLPRAGQLANVPYRVVTLLVFQPLKSSDVRDEHFVNMFAIVVALAVFRLEQPVMEVQEVNPENREDESALAYSVAKKGTMVRSYFPVTEDGTA